MQIELKSVSIHQTDKEQKSVYSTVLSRLQEVGNHITGS